MQETTDTYDALNRLQQLSHKKADGSTIASYTYGYDAASRITSLGSQFANAAYNDNSTYSYDNTNQLAGADHSAIHRSQVSALIFLGTLA